MNFNITKEYVDQMILGSMLGDGSVEKPTGLAVNYNLSFTQAIWEEEYLKHKHDLMESFYKVYDIRDGHNNTKRFNVSTKELILTNYIRNISRYSDNTRKMPDNELITPVVLLYWYLDDGSLSITECKRSGRKSSISRKLRIHLQSYKDSDILRIMEYLNQTYNLNMTAQYEKINNKRKITALCINNNFTGITNFLDLIIPYKHLIPDCMHYKFCMMFTPTLQIQDMVNDKYNCCNVATTGICTCRDLDLSECVNWKILKSKFNIERNSTTIKYTQGSGNKDPEDIV